jgi:hypothetical protein
LKEISRNLRESSLRGKRCGKVKMSSCRLSGHRQSVISGKVTGRPKKSDRLWMGTS